MSSSSSKTCVQRVWKEERDTNKGTKREGKTLQPCTNRSPARTKREIGKRDTGSAPSGSVPFEDCKKPFRSFFRAWEHFNQFLMNILTHCKALLGELFLSMAKMDKTTRTSVTILLYRTNKTNSDTNDTISRRHNCIWSIRKTWRESNRVIYGRILFGHAIICLMCENVLGEWYFYADRGKVA